MIFGYRRHSSGYYIFKTIVMIIALVIVAIIYFFFTPSQSLECITDKGCSVYRKANRVSKQELEYSFNPKEILNFKYVEHYHSRKHGRGYYTYSIVLNMKDGKRIDLDTFEGSKASQQEMVNDMWYNKTFTKKSRF